MHILQELFTLQLLLQMTDASLTQLNRDRRSPNIQNIRLAGNGGTQYMGRVEIQGPNGTWGTVCDDGFDFNDATVVCRMLGFTSRYVSAYDRAYFGAGSGPVWLDDLGCNGNETDLEQCTSSGWGRPNCGHDEDAAVACGFLVKNIRLAGNGSTNSRGRVEVSSPNGTWGTICGIGFDPFDAKVICRMLGFNNSSGIAYYSNYFGAGSRPEWIYILGCRGYETHLDQCPSSSKETTCYQYSNAGVACGVNTVVQNVRLVGGRGAHEGRVEMLGPDETWGTLVNRIDENAASVICRMLGFEKGYEEVFYNAFFGRGSGQTYYSDNYQCTGRETNNAECFIYGIWVNFLGHERDVGVSCQKETNIRLVGGNSELEGRVEVYYNDIWGTVCSNGFDSRDAEVVCYMLGYDTGSVHLYTDARYGSGKGQIWLDNVSCNGTESRLNECPLLSWGTNNCSHSQDVGVDCRHSVQLYGGRYISEGYVQIGNDWKTVCLSDEKAAQAVCHILGFNTSYWNPQVYSKDESMITSNPRLVCKGTESDVAECKQAICICSYNCAFYVNCIGSLKGRLVGGAHSWEGKLQIQNRLNSRLFRVCTDVWTDKEATLFCQLFPRLNKGEVYGRVIRNTAFDQQPGSFVFLSTHCNGGLPFCIFEVNSTESCPYTDIAMSCAHVESGSQHYVRLMGGKDEYEGGVEIKFNNTWHTLCPAGWDENDAVVVCRSLGYWVSSPTTYTYAWIGHGSVTSFQTQPYCYNNELSIFDCETGSSWIYSSCLDSKRAGVQCIITALGRDKVRLAYGSAPSNGKLEVLYNGQWGGVCLKSWTQMNTDVVCRMMMYHSVRPYYSVFKGISTTILIGDLYCRGDEADIGLCKAFLDKSNCTDEVVGIDCFGVNECLSYPCEHGGNCTNTNGTYSCNCPSGWQGKNCSIDVNECLSSPCEHGGNCTNTNGTYSCTCPRGWQGKSCYTDVNECLSSPCEHGGNCTNTNGTYSCDCPHGWQGKDCSTDVNECLSFPCEHGGNCNNTDGTYSCDCQIGWQGRHCSTDINECVSSPCEHGGNCTNTNGTYSCDCPHGWQGEDCSTDVTLLSTTPETNTPSDPHRFSPEAYESTEELTVLRAAVGSCAGLLVISVLLICCLIRKIRRMQNKNKKERLHANPKTTEDKTREYYNMSVQDKTKIRNMPETLCTISTRTPSNESLSDEQGYTTLDICERNVEHEYSHLK